MQTLRVVINPVIRGHGDAQIVEQANPIPSSQWCICTIRPKKFCPKFRFLSGTLECHLKSNHLLYVIELKFLYNIFDGWLIFENLNFNQPIVYNVQKTSMLVGHALSILFLFYNFMFATVRK